MDQTQAISNLAVAWLTGGLGSVLVTFLLRKVTPIFGTNAKVAAGVIAGIIGLSAGFCVTGVPHTLQEGFLLVAGAAIAAEKIYEYLNLYSKPTKGEPVAPAQQD